MMAYTSYPIPKNWILSRFADYLDIQGGSQPPKKYFSDQPNIDYIRLYQIRDLGDKPMPVYVDKKRISKFCKKGDILIGRYGASVGKVFWAKDGAYNVALVKILYNEKLFNKSYLFYFLKSQFFQQRLALISKTAQDGFNKNDLSKIPVPVAPINEQKRIISKIEELFSKLDEAEAALKRTQKLLSTYRQSILKSAVTGDIINSNYNDWKKYNLEELLSDVRYGTAKKCTLNPSKTPVLRIPNVKHGRIDLSDLKHADFTQKELEKIKLQNGDLLLVRSNGSASLVARTAVVGVESFGFAYAGYLIRLRVKKDKILPEFLHLFFHSPIVRGIIDSHIKSTSGVHNINSDEIKKIPIKISSIKIQEKIVDSVDEIFSKINILEGWCESELVRSFSLRRSILRYAFSGKLVPQDDNDEPASVLLERIRQERENNHAEKPKVAKRKTIRKEKEPYEQEQY